MKEYVPLFQSYESDRFIIPDNYAVPLSGVTKNGKQYHVSDGRREEKTYVKTEDHSRREYIPWKATVTYARATVLFLIIGMCMFLVVSILSLLMYITGYLAITVSVFAGLLSGLYAGITSFNDHITTRIRPVSVEGHRDWEAAQIMHVVITHRPDLREEYDLLITMMNNHRTLEEVRYVKDQLKHKITNMV